MTEPADVQPTTDVPADVVPTTAAAAGEPAAVVPPTASVSVTAKVLCTRKTQQYGTDGAQFDFGPNYNDATGKNAEWAKYTPSLNLSLTVKNADMFELGRAYTLTFTPDEG